MSIGLCFHFETTDRDLWSGRKIDLDAWQTMCVAFDVKKVVCIDLAGWAHIDWPQGGPDLKIVKSLEEFEEYAGEDSLERRIYVETPWTVPKENSPPITPYRSINLTTDDIYWLIIGPSAGIKPSSNRKHYYTVPQEGGKNGKGPSLYPVHMASVPLSHFYLIHKGMV